MLNGLDLFSGIGGLSLALSEWVRPVAYCEIDPYCQGVLLSRQNNGYLMSAPIFSDVSNLEGNRFAHCTDIIYGGFPCQDISIAGVGKGLEGERSGLFFEILRLAKEIRPKFIFLENVPAILSRGGIRVVTEIAEMGYGCRWCVLSAESVGAPHKRERWFLLAHSKSKRLSEGGLCIREEATHSNVNNSNQYKIGNHWKENEPEMVGMANGISGYVDRVRALGNGVVPEQAKEAFKILMGVK